MASLWNRSFLAAAAAALVVSACSQSRPAADAGGTPAPAPPETCVLCHGQVGRAGNLPGTDVYLTAAPPAAPKGKPSSVIGAHLVHVNPPILNPLRTPIACAECHVVPTSFSHASNPPANPVQFGTIATAHGASPTYDPTTLGCAAVYCHGNFDYNGVRGKAASVIWTGGVVGCGACHDLPPTGHPTLSGTVTPATCSQCHPNTVNPDGTINVNAGAHINGQADVVFSCTSCHGTAGRTGIQAGTDPQLAAAPPAAPTGAPSYAVGAHQSHLNPPLTGSLRGPLPCSECHVVPSTPAHATTPPAQRVVFGSLASTQGAQPTWNPTSTGCSATYCHGNFAFNGVAGGNATPLWTGAALTCTSCHGMPPTGHPALSGSVTAATCAQCHPSTVNPNGTINLNGGAHLNGQADVVLDCTSCHGTAGRTGIQTGTDPQLAAAPPIAPAGAPAFATGAHQSHLNPPATGSFRAPLACGECHVVPADSTHATNPPAQRVVFGTLSTTQGAQPTWNPTSTGCSATYCHGNFTFNGVAGASATPLWTGAALTCTSCHGMPPTGHPAIAGTVTAATCNQCHPTSVNADGTINLTGGTHLNGVANVSINCTSCHGTAGRTGNLPGTDPQLAVSPPVATNAASVGAHQAHVNPTSSLALRAPILCNECHVVPASTAHATNPPANPVVFGPLAKTQGATPTYNGTTLSCSATYCHGSFSYNGVAGAAAAPLWSGAAMTCTSCHGLPPTGHPTLSGTVTAATCSQCHPATVNANGTINLTGGAHLNGQADVATSCTSCHGDPARTVPAGNPNALLAAAPPVPPAGKPAAVSGTHLLHLTDSAIRKAVNCNECHVVPGNADHAIQFPTVIVFSPATLATTQGAAPTYDATTLSCSATYCHGKFTYGGVTGSAAATPAWNATPTLACTTCHGMPPTGHPALSGTVTAVTCNQCHPSTVKADGTIDVAGGKHMNGQAEVSGNPHTGDPQWVLFSHHGYAANQQGLGSCTQCHVNFGSPSGGTGGDCNACHTATGFSTWQTNCTFCHGTTGRTGNVTGTDARLAAAPPVGPQGESATTQAAVGAHQRHVNPPASGRLAAPIACTNCHPSPLPTDVTHVNGLAVPVPFGGIAITGNVVPSFNATTLGCSATYCHGNFTSGQTTAVPVWTGQSSMTCTSCHLMPTTATGKHSVHMGRTGANCSWCHTGVATGTGNPSTNAVVTGPDLHVNGVKNVAFGGTLGSVTLGGSYNATTLGCSATYCHGNFTNGQTTAVPLWTGAAMACNSCHKMPNTSTGRHSTHSSINCSECHNGIASGTGTNVTIVDQTLHVNGVVNVVITAAGFTSTGSGTTRRCNGTCHSMSHSSFTW